MRVLEIWALTKQPKLCQTAQSFVGESSLEIAELNSKRKSVQELWKEGKAKLKTNKKSKRNVLDFEYRSVKQSLFNKLD